MTLRTAGLHLFVLSAFALAQPVFDLLGQNGEFFGARGSTGWDVVLFAVTLVLVPPGVLLAVEALAPRRIRPALHAVLVAGLTGLLVLQAIRGLGAPGWLLAAVAGLVGVAGTAAYARAGAVRLLLTVLAPAPVLFLALFLFHSDASRLTLSGPQAAYAAGERPRAPVVMVVFDELPVNSLLDTRGRPDPVRFPHFAALARRSTWFENESVVSEGTLHGVPSLLTGLYPRPGELPVYHDHPRSLFTLLGRGAGLHVFETETHICPPKLCHASSGALDRLGSLYADTSVVYLHQLLPDDLARGIPSVSNGWEGFWQNGGGAADPERRFDRFLRTIRPARQPALWYLHVLLPHSPWRFLPSGERYAIRPAPGWNGAEIWNDNQAAVDQYWQRHLLQLAFADRLLGRLVERLRATGLYARSLLVVTADEGLSFRAGQKRRPASQANLQDIGYVPLLVKLPRQPSGRVVGAPTRSVDVLPTIAGALGVRIPWRVDGRDVLARSARPERFVVLAKDHGRRFVVPAAALEARRRSALRRQLALFGSGEPASTLFAVGPDRGLLGRRLHGGRQVTDLDPVDRSGSLVQVSGRVDGPARSVAVVAGGRVVAVDPVVDGRFWALAPTRAAVRVFAVR